MEREDSVEARSRALEKKLDDTEKPEDIAKQYKKYLGAPKYDLNSEELYCICRQPDRGGELMISCDGCEDWFHARCMKVQPHLASLLDRFFCKFCVWKGIGVTLWKRRCRRPGCDKPIRKELKSKYCSDECGEHYLRDMLAELSKAHGFTRQDARFVVEHCKTREELESFGGSFPELPEVVLGDISKFPEALRSVLATNDEKQAQLKQDLSTCEAQDIQLIKVKELIKSINEACQAEQPDEPKKRKKGGVRKVDLCCYKPDFDSLTDAEYFRQLCDDAIQAHAQEQDYAGNMCIKDRKKCLKHNGWYALRYDQIYKRQSELHIAMEELANERQEALRDYSISVYDEIV